MCFLLMFQNDFQSPQQTLPPERIRNGLLMANMQVFHGFPPGPHFEAGEERKLKREIFSAPHVSA